MSLIRHYLKTVPKVLVPIPDRGDALPKVGTWARHHALLARVSREGAALHIKVSCSTPVPPKVQEMTDRESKHGSLRASQTVSRIVQWKAESL